jgi:hypothetical protein
MKHIRKFNEANIERETLEEAAEKYSKQFDYAEDSSPQIDFIEGAKYMAERMYSEEEVLELLLKMNEWPTTFDGEEDIKEWFKLFKNKLYNITK